MSEHKSFHLRPALAGNATLRALLVTAALAIPGLSWAQDDCAAIAPEFPSRPINLVVGFPAGGQTDQVGRILAAAMSERIKQPVMVDNRGGAAGTIGAAAVARSKGDGYTLYLATVGTQTIQPSLMTNLPYDSLKAFAPVAYVTTAPMVFVARADSSARSINDMINVQKTRQASIALPGIGTAPHMASALLENIARFKALGVQYRGNAPALNDLLGGQVDFMVDSVTTALPHIKSGSLRALGVSSKERSAVIPDVPSVSEQVPGYPDVGAWWGIVAPAATPEPIVRKLHCEINSVLADPAVQEKFKALGSNPGTMSIAQFSDLIQREHATWKKVIEEANIKLD